MRIVFTWQPKEWRELYLLATTEQQRAASSPSMAYLVVGVMALGGLSDVVHTLRASRSLGLRGTLLPELLGIALLLGAVLLGMRLWARHRSLRGLPPLPLGEQQIVLQETGWRAASVTDPENEVQPWTELATQRRGDNVVALITRDGRITGFPLRAMQEEQAGSVQRLLIRKLAPPPF